MPEISSITLPSGTKYDIKDAQAREDIASIEASIAGGMTVVGETSTELEDGSLLDIIVINGENHRARKGDLVWYQNSEFLYDGDEWKFIGDLSAIGALGYKDSAQGLFTPSGSISQPTFSGNLLNSEGVFTPNGEIQVLPEAVENYTPSGTISQPTFSGSTMTSTGTYTPAGTVSKPSIIITPATGTVASIDDVGTLPSFTATVANENLTLGFNPGSLPTKGADQYVLTGAIAELDSAPIFTGSEATIISEGTPEGSVSQPSFIGTGVHFEFIGQEDDIGVSGVPEGNISVPVFTGAPGTVTVT